MSQQAWSQRFTDVEKTAAKDIEATSSSFEWLASGASAVIAGVFFIHAGMRFRSGDIFGAFLSLVAGMVSAAAPEIARNIIF